MKRSTAKGFTLIEIMIALGIGAFLLSGIFQIFISLKYTDRLSSSLSRIQESGRTAMEFMANDIRMTGYKGCADPVLKENVNIVAKTPPTTDFVDLALRGFDVTANGWATGDDDDLSAIDGGGDNQARLNSDVVVILHASQDSENISAHSNSGATITIANNSLGLASGDLAVASDCELMDIFRVSSIGSSSGAVTVGHGSGQNSSSSLSKIYNSQTARLYRFEGNAYFVGDTGRTNTQGDPLFALFRRDAEGNVEEIVEGVEYMQIQYGETLNSGNQRLVSASDGSLDMVDVTSVKMSLLLVSNDPVLDNDDTFEYQLADQRYQPESSGGNLTYPNDRRLRRVFSISMNLRNREVNL